MKVEWNIFVLCCFRTANEAATERQKYCWKILFQVLSDIKTMLFWLELNIFAIFFEKDPVDIHFWKTLMKQHCTTRSFTPATSNHLTYWATKPSFSALLVSDTLISSVCLSEMLRNTRGYHFNNFLVIQPMVLNSTE